MVLKVLIFQLLLLLCHFKLKQDNILLGHNTLHQLKYFGLEATMKVVSKAFFHLNKGSKLSTCV